ncbi:MAG: efflux RND transporter permease subunit [Deltaproteobacteria bacterium]|nr:efflux RND transporter permease subunit [Deltaproteobacteria bacterium]
MHQLQATADKAKAVIATVAGVADLGIVKSAQVPQIAVHLKRDALARYDLDLADVQNFVETALGGHTVSDFWDGETKFDIRVPFPSSSREDAFSIRRLMLPLADGSVIPLAAVAEIRAETGRAAITRENGRCYVSIRMNVRNRDLGSFVAEARSKVDGAVKLPAGYEMNWGGEFESQERAMARLRLVIPLSLLITFFLLFSTLGAVGDALIVLLNVPFALVGGVLALALFGMTLSVSAAVGFIALLGQSVLNGVLVVAAIKQRHAAGEPLEKAVEVGALERLRAVLMTALLASLGLLPAALSNAIGSETQRPIAVVVVFGTISSALLTLIVLPVTTLWAAKIAARFRRARGAPAESAVSVEPR